MTSINQKAVQNVQHSQAANADFTQSATQGYGAAISTTCATVAMTAFLWAQIVASLVQPIA